MTRPPSKLALVAMGLIILPACSTVAELPTERIAAATLTRPNGVPVGTVQLLANGNDLSLAVAVSGLPQGAHGFHLHTVGACKAPDFSSAGGHLNPAGKAHGRMNPGGSHLGDLPNLEIGSGALTSTTIDLDDDRAEVLSSIFDDDGTAIVIHADADDYKTDPSGNAGSRIACGVLKRV